MKSLVLLLLSAILLSFSIQVFAQQVENLLLHYEFNNDFTDSSPNEHDGVGANGMFVEDYLGNPESALSANGVDTYVDIPQLNELEPGFPITVAVRAKFDFLDGTQIPFTTDYSLNNHSGVWIQSGENGSFKAAFGNAQGGFNSSSRRGKTTVNSFKPDTWYNIVAVFSGPNNIEIYVDCKLQEGSYSGAALNIGYTDQPGSLCRKRANPEFILPPYYFDGAVDDFKMWNVALTEEEILNLCEPPKYECPDFSANIGEPCEMDGQIGVLNIFCECILETDTTQSLECRITIPNVFTPNGDGRNDRFIPNIDCELSEYQMLIFNRWGNLVFRTTDINIGWNGRNSKQKITPGVYFYTIEFTPKSDMPNTTSGKITLLE